MSVLREAIAAGKKAYDAAAQRRDDALDDVVKAEKAVLDAEAAHEALEANAVAGKPVTAEQLGIAMYTIAGAKSLVEVKKAVVVAREADVSETLKPVQQAMMRSASARAKAMRDTVDALMAESNRLRELANEKGQFLVVAQRVPSMITARNTPAGGYSAENAVKGNVQLSELEPPPR